MQNASLPELIPRENFFDRSTSKYAFQVSPNGKQLAWLADHKGFITIFYRAIGTEKESMINTQSWCNVSWYRWAQDSRHLIYSLSAGRERAQHIFISDSKNPDKDPFNLTPEAKYRASLLSTSRYDPDHIFLIQNKNRAESYDFYKINIKSGDDELIGQSHDSVLEWITDRKGILKARIRADVSKNWHLEILKSKSHAWDKVATWGTKESIQSLGMTPDNRGVWLLSNKNRDRISLVRFDLKSKKESLVCEDPEADIEGAYISHISGKPMFAYAYPDYPKTYILNPELKAEMAVFKTDSHGGLEILGMDDEEKLLTVKTFNEKKEPFYLYDRSSGQKQFLGNNQLQKDITPLVNTKPVKIQSRDDISLRGYLTRPAGTGSQPLPMVLYVHGGPWARDYWQQDKMVQFLANRGYVVLQVNYRGSEGYGRAYKEAAIKEFAGNMHNDLIDAVDWAIDKNIADPEKIAIVGGSYGGFASMAGLSFTPDVFACGVSINGVSDWGDFVSSFPSNLPIWKKRGFEIWYDYMGNPVNPDEKKDMEERSPFFYADRVKKPILIIYGEQDQTVEPGQSEKMIKALQMHGKVVEYQKFENEGHGISWHHNSMVMFKKIEEFLALYLGGRSEG